MPPRRMASYKLAREIRSPEQKKNTLMIIRDNRRSGNIIYAQVVLFLLSVFIYLQPRSQRRPDHRTQPRPRRFPRSDQHWTRQPGPRTKRNATFLSLWKSCPLAILSARLLLSGNKNQGEDTSPRVEHKLAFFRPPFFLAQYIAK